MELLRAIQTITNAIDESAKQADDVAWSAAVQAAGLVSQGNTSLMGIDENFDRVFGPFTLCFHHRWWDTSGPFSPGPDRSRLTLTLLSGVSTVSSYTNGYDS